MFAGSVKSTRSTARRIWVPSPPPRRSIRVEERSTADMSSRPADSAPGIALQVPFPL